MDHTPNNVKPHNHEVITKKQQQTIRDSDLFRSLSPNPHFSSSRKVRWLFEKKKDECKQCSARDIEMRRMRYGDVGGEKQDREGPPHARGLLGEVKPRITCASSSPEEVKFLRAWKGLSCTYVIFCIRAPRCKSRVRNLGRPCAPVRNGMVYWSLEEEVVFRWR